MSGTHAPAELPFVPRPMRTELFTSWLLRVAAENHVSVSELISGFTSVYPGIPLPCSLDRAIDRDFLRAFSQFSRVHFHTLNALDLNTRLQRSHRAVLLQFPSSSKPSPRRCDLRAGYAFCPLCIAQDLIIHVRWDWCFAGLIRCNVHDALLQLGCQICEEPDPPIFSATQTMASHACGSCGTDLTLRTGRSKHALARNITAIDQAYRAALMSVEPNSELLGQVSDEQFQSLVDDLLELLADEKCRQQLRRCKRQQEGSLSAQPRLAALADLILNAIPMTDPQTRSNRHRRSLKLWTKILCPIRENDEVALKRSTRSWPAAVRARFDHAQTHRERNKRLWRTGPLSAGSPRFKCCKLGQQPEIRDLNAARHSCWRSLV
jgi:TniQ